jgi:DNA-binding XRE family transcriptional regulator
MSAVAKMCHTEIIIDGKHPQYFLVPEAAAKGLLVLFKNYKVDKDEDEEYIDAEEAVSHLFVESSKATVRLRGFRHRDGLTQDELAKKLKTTQSVIASLENGTRPISYKMAQRLAKFFDTNTDAFLEK